jgi:hypothetical protein
MDMFILKHIVTSIKYITVKSHLETFGFSKIAHVDIRPKARFDQARSGVWETFWANSPGGEGQLHGFHDAS